MKEGMKIMMMGSQEEKLVSFYYNKVLDTMYLSYYAMRSILIPLPTCIR